MIKIVMLVALFLSVDAFGFTQVKDSSVETCTKVKELLDLNNTKLEEAYYLNAILACGSSNDYKNYSRDEWLASNFYTQHRKRINDLVFEADYKIEDVELIALLKNKFYLTPKNHERIKKGYLASLEIDSSHLEGGEHPYEPHKMAESLYFDISSRYYANGMKDDGDRILDELRQLPYQYLPDIERAQKWGHEAYSRWELEQKKTQDNATDSIEIKARAEITGSESKVSEEAEAESEADVDGLSSESETIKLDPGMKPYGLFLLGFLALLSLYLFSNRKRKK